MTSPPCRRCSECDGHHHFSDAIITDDGDYQCKHCDAIGYECEACDGSGGSGGFDGEPHEPCENCKGRGVVLQSQVAELMGDGS